jgi:PAS domain S-box-containing protein
MNKAALNILVIEDNPGDFALVSEYLLEAFENANIFHAVDIQSAISSISQTVFDILLLDLTLPDGMGLDTFLTIQEAADTPIIILTGLQETRLALDSVKHGAQDYIVKDNCNGTTLFKSINYAIERSKINERLKKSEEQYKYLFNNNPLPMWAFDRQTFQFLMVNGAALNHYGYTEPEFLSMSLGDITVRPGSDKLLHKTFACLPNNMPGDFTHRRKDNQEIDVEIVCHDIILESREASLAVIHDVTEKNIAREKLNSSEQMFRKISENFPNGIVAILDRKLHAIYCAGSEFQKQGFDIVNFNHIYYPSHFKPGSKEKIEDNLNEVFQGKNRVFEAEYGTTNYMISAVPLHEGDGSIERILIATQNITDQKKNAKEKELLIEELTQNNSDLRQFSYITSHNLRAPLSNLIGIIKLLNTTTITDPVNVLLLKNFEECTLQLNETVNDLINVLIIKNNVNAGKEILNIEKVLDRVTNSIRSTIEKHELDLQVDVSHADEILFNHTYLESIFLNLLTNAIKYRSPNRKPKVIINSQKVDNGVRLYFRDNGLGIDLDRYGDRIFGLYQRFHDHADSKGLGLYIVNSQIRVMGGEIAIESQVNKGTTFILSFKN